MKGERKKATSPYRDDNEAPGLGRREYRKKKKFTLERIDTRRVWSCQ